LDITFTTGDTFGKVDQGMFFNNWGLGSTLGYIDNWEMYEMVSSKKKIAYVNYSGLSMDPTASQPASDPIITMLKADGNFDVDVLLVTADSVLDLSGYDVVVAQEGFSSSGAIYKPGGSLGMGSIPVPFVYNKAFAMKAGRGFATGASGSGSEVKGTYSINVPTANQTNPLFNGITFAGETIKIFRSGAADNGADTDTKGLQFANDVVISTTGTLLASGINDPATATVCLNDIPAGSTIGSETLKARMIAIAQNFGAINKADGANFTNEGLTIWRNAIYSLAGLEVPTTLLDAPGDDPILSSDATLSALTISIGSLTPAFSADVMAYAVNLPTGTTTADITATATDAKATVAGAGNVTFTETGKVVDVVVTAEDGTSKTYSITITVGVGVTDMRVAGMKLYPNPAKGFIMVEGLKANANYKVVNAIGQQIATGTATGKTMQLNLSGYDAGIYMIRIEMEGKAYTSRFVKE